jgi:uncharacterized protein with von Willebrand factor type A (vWA) domain
MRRLAERAHRVVWLNPLAGRPGYAPEARGMAAALAHIDDFLPIHDLASLHALALQLGRLPRRKGAGDAAAARSSFAHVEVPR